MAARREGPRLGRRCQGRRGAARGSRGGGQSGPTNGSLTGEKRNVCWGLGGQSVCLSVFLSFCVCVCVIWKSGREQSVCGQHFPKATPPGEAWRAPLSALHPLGSAVGCHLHDSPLGARRRRRTQCTGGVVFRLLLSGLNRVSSKRRAVQSSAAILQEETNPRSGGGARTLSLRLRLRWHILVTKQ